MSALGPRRATSFHGLLTFYPVADFLNTINNVSGNASLQITVVYNKRIAALVNYVKHLCDSSVSV